MSSTTNPSNRLLNLAIKGIAGELLLTEFSGTEGLSELFHYQLKLHTPASLSHVLNASATVTLTDPEGNQRYFNGLISRCIPGLKAANHFQYYELELVSWLCYLNKNRANRVFIAKTPRQIIQEIFSAYTNSHVDLSKLQGGNTALEYFVQYQESDYHFIARLCEQAGFFYYFSQSQQSHQLIISDQLSAYQDSGVSMTYTMMKPAYSDLTVWDHEYTVTNNHIQQSDYNFETPGNSLFQEVSGSTSNGALDYCYIYPGNYKSTNEGAELTKIRSKEATLRNSVVQAVSKYSKLSAGSTFQVTQHDIGAEQGGYLVTHLVHHAIDNSSIATGPSDNTSDTKKYTNKISCITSNQRYYPPLKTEIPKIPGIQTGIVVGPAGEEIYTDEYGRIQVQFHWFQAKTNKPASSYWIRVAQAWAGNSWGSQFIPRIGHEVIINFENGDPSRPIVGGSAYNGNNLPPYPLPGQQARSGIKTRSTTQGDSSQYNEIYFDDVLGSEEIYIHAQKNLNQIVNHDEVINVMNNHALTVSQGDQVIKVPKGSITVTAGNMIKLTAGSSKINIDASGITIVGSVVKINS